MPIAFVSNVLSFCVFHLQVLCETLFLEGIEFIFCALGSYVSSTSSPRNPDLLHRLEFLLPIWPQWYAHIFKK